MKFICKSCRDQYFDDREEDEKINHELLCQSCAEDFRNLIRSAQEIREQLLMHIRALKKYQ